MQCTESTKLSRLDFCCCCAREQQLPAKAQTTTTTTTKGTLSLLRTSASPPVRLFPSSRTVISTFPTGVPSHQKQKHQRMAFELGFVCCWAGRLFGFGKSFCLSAVGKRNGCVCVGLRALRCHSNSYHQGNRASRAELPEQSHPPVRFSPTLVETDTEFSRHR